MKSIIQAGTIPAWATLENKTIYEMQDKKKAFQLFCKVGRLIPESGAETAKLFELLLKYIS
ncbi:MAG: hypothetical protein KBS89_05840 [Bacteroidales bacterium]|nr:hypothetical protein [Candidatus Egerieousia equi]MCQ2117940.1 hypothetical protein [Bacteroidales bacterium]